jgi:AcrR family transcriptional regulator
MQERTGQVSSGVETSLAKGRKPAKSREAFLDAAVRLFAKRGYDGMTIRDVAREAGTTLGTLHYHWGNKDALVQEICTRQLAPMVEARLARYEQVTGESRDERIASLLRAHFEPFVEIFGGSDADRAQVQNFYTRVSSDPSPAVRAISTEVMREMSRAFVRRLRALCDHLPDREFYWRLNGVLGTTLHMQAYSGRLLDLVKRAELDSDPTDHADIRSGIESTVHFLTVALSAPPMGEGQAPAR